MQTLAEQIEDEATSILAYERKHLRRFGLAGANIAPAFPLDKGTGTGWIGGWMFGPGCKAAFHAVLRCRVGTYLATPERHAM